MSWRGSPPAKGTVQRSIRSRASDHVRRVYSTSSPERVEYHLSDGHLALQLIDPQARRP